MEIKQWDEARDFYRRAEGFLIAHEAHNNLLLGIVAGLIEHPERVQSPPYLATVEEDDEVVGAAVLTPPYNLVVSRLERNAPTALSLIAADAHRNHPDLPGVVAPDDLAPAFADAWHGLTGQTARREKALRIFQLDTVVPVTGVPGELRRATEADRDLMIAWLGAFAAEAFGEDHAGDAERSADARLTTRTSAMYFWQDGEPRSMAGYTGPTPNGVRVGPVYTPPEHRGRGYASACVAVLSQLLLESGRRYCFLFTDLANPTSNHIYQQIGYTPVCDVDEYRFASVAD